MSRSALAMLASWSFLLNVWPFLNTCLHAVVSSAWNILHLNVHVVHSAPSALYAC